jgi:hypothetical protein
MPQVNSVRRKPASRTVIATAILLLACLGVAACGESSSGNSTSSNASAATPAGAGAVGSTSTHTSTTPTSTSTTPTSTSTTPSTPTKAPTGEAARARGALASRVKALRECLQKNAVTSPQPGKRPPGGASGRVLPSGVTPAQYRAALQKCGAGGLLSGLLGGGGARARRLQSPAFEQALSKYAACMRQNGVSLPKPNTSGTGPIFDTKGLNTASAKYRAAEAKCRSDLRSALPLGAGAGAPGARTTPGAGALPLR